MYYYSPDLADYVRETSDSAKGKTNVLLLNKADFLSREQREAWAKYFSESDLNAVFFSATLDDDEVRVTLNSSQ
jgi:large subunit GTPase 1